MKGKPGDQVHGAQKHGLPKAAGKKATANFKLSRRDPSHR